MPYLDFIPILRWTPRFFVLNIIFINATIEIKFKNNLSYEYNIGNGMYVNGILRISAHAPKSKSSIDYACHDNIIIYAYMEFNTYGYIIIMQLYSYIYVYHTFIYLYLCVLCQVGIHDFNTHLGAPPPS